MLGLKNLREAHEESQYLKGCFVRRRAFSRRVFSCDAKRFRSERVADAYVTLSECSAIAIIKHVPHASLLELFQFSRQSRNN